MGHYTKYPVVLVHGLAAKNVPFCGDFGYIARFLRKQNIITYVTNQDGVGTIETNAQQLKTEIKAICQAESCEKVNLIAHSKGGLDARYMISALDMAPHIASLTTLSTPHHGSELCSAILQYPSWLIRFICFFINVFYRILRDENPDILAVARELTHTAMEAFNKTIRNHPGIYYQSYSSQASKSNAFLVFLPYQISKHCEQAETDGVVSVVSSQWGDYKGQIQGDPNHLQIIALAGSRKKRQKVAAFYLHIITELRNMGF